MSFRRDQLSIRLGEEKDESNCLECYRCGFKMTPIQPCHLRCNNCGTELTCSDKGSFW